MRVSGGDLCTLVQKHRPTDTTGETVGATCCTRRDWKNGKDIESLPFLALFVFCEWAVHALGLEYKLRDVRENTPEQLDRAAALLREYFPTVVVN